MDKCLYMTFVDVKQILDKKIPSLVKRSRVNKKYIPSKGTFTYADFFSNKMLMVSMIKEGVSYEFFDVIKDNSPFDEKEWAVFLDVSTKSLHRYKQLSRNFKSIQSEKIIEIAEVINVGLDVFGDMDKFKLWLNTPNFALGSLKPVELLGASYGKELVIGELIRISYGILA